MTTRPVERLRDRSTGDLIRELSESMGGSPDGGNKNLFERVKDALG